jgi:hypothetical protein
VRALVEGAQADEVMVLTMAPDATSRRRSYELLADALGATNRASDAVTDDAAGDAPA